MGFEEGEYESRMDEWRCKGAMVGAEECNVEGVTGL
jgi:Pyruvate/2-oxoacid:ferredoxin oxidoreductase delta subunit